jgi:hypothetical protein
MEEATQMWKGGHARCGRDWFIATKTLKYTDYGK